MELRDARSYTRAPAYQGTDANPDPRDARYPLYIEDFGDAGDGDWSPIFEAVCESFNRRSPIGSPENFLRYRSTGSTVLLGKSRKIYRLSRPLDIFAGIFMGIYPDTELFFYNNTDGVQCHYPRTNPGNVPRDGSHSSGYGSTYFKIQLKNLWVRVTGAGTRGVRAFTAIHADNVAVWNAGYHGWEIAASVETAEGAIANVNLYDLRNCAAYNCGNNPGNDAQGNPRTWGAGLYIVGSDTNAGSTYKFNAANGNGWGIWDNSFLGNAHYMPHVAARIHPFDPVRDYPAFFAEMDNNFDRHKIPVVGQNTSYALRMNGNGARGAFFTPYIESSAQNFVDCQAPSKIYGGFGGVTTARTVIELPSTNRMLMVNHGVQSTNEYEEPSVLELGGSSLLDGYFDALDHSSYRVQRQFEKSRQRVRVTVTTPAEGLWRLTITGTNCDFTATAESTTAEILTGLEASVRAATPFTTNVIGITNRTGYFEFFYRPLAGTRRWNQSVAFSSTVPQGGAMTVSQVQSATPYSGWWTEKGDSGSNAVGRAIAGSNSAIGTRVIPRGRQWLPMGVHLGSSGVFLQASTEAARPDPTTLAVGDIYFNSAPTEGSSLGWRVVNNAGTNVWENI